MHWFGGLLIGPGVALAAWLVPDGLPQGEILGAARSDLMSTEDAEGYVEHWEPVLRPAVDRLLDQLAPLAALARSSGGRPARLLDLGTGTGQLAFAALERWPKFEVVGIDRDAAMLQVARRRSAHRVTSASLSLVEGSAEELPFEDAAFDLVGSSFVIDLLERGRAFREVRRVLRPGGAFGAVAWLPAGADFAPRQIVVEALIDITPPPVIARGVPSPAALATQLRRAGFGRVSAVQGELVHRWSVDEFLAYVAACGWRAVLADMTPAERKRRMRSMRRGLAALPALAFDSRRATVTTIARRV